MKKKPLVSVNIRTFNSERTLEKTLNSVKNQTHPIMEIIVSDGYSKDRSVEIAKLYGAKVHYVAKLGDARYQDYRKSKGKYLLSLDSDQILDSGAIEECVRLCEDKDFDAVIISEKSIIDKGTFLQKLIGYDKWLVDKSQDADINYRKMLRNGSP